MARKIYISGPITGYDREERKRTFAAAAKHYEDLGYKAVNPMEGEEEGLEWEDYMRRDIEKLCKCDAIAMLPGWEDSKGARLEYEVAMALGMWYEECAIEEGGEG